MPTINVTSSVLKGVFYLFLLSTSACQNTPLTLPSLESPTILPTETTFIPTVTEDLGVPTNNQLGSIITPLPSFDDYIIYNNFETSTDYKIWAINPSDRTPRLITRNLNPWSWSPSNKLWLFTGNKSIYVANADGSDINAVYTYKEYQGVEPFWLTDDIVLFNAYKDIISQPPDIYSLNINSGEIIQLFPGESKFIQVTFPSERKWLLADWPIGPLTLVNQNNEVEPFFNNFSIPTNIFSPYPPIQRINKLDKYLFKAKGPREDSYKLWLVSRQETHRVLFDPGSDGIDQFAVSPDEQYVALTYNTIDGVYLYIFRLDNLQMLYKWVYPYTLSAGYFVWSPDSESIVLPYSESGTGNSNEVHFGIQAMDMKTGETRIILKEDVTEILDWHSIE